MHDKLIALLKTVSEKITDGSDMVWTRYDQARELREELECHILKLSQGQADNLEELCLHFAPTSTFQEHALSNGWADEYLVLAAQFDEVYTKMKKR